MSGEGRLAALAAFLLAASLAACSGPGASPLGEPTVSAVTPDRVSREGGTVTITGTNLFEAGSGLGFPAELRAELCGMPLRDLRLQGQERTVTMPPAGRVSVTVGAALTGTLAGHELDGPGDLVLTLPDGRRVTAEGVVDCYDPAPKVGGLAFEPAGPHAGSPVSFAWQAASPDGLALSCTLDLGDGTAVTPSDCGAGGVTHTYMAEGAYTVRLVVTDEEGREAERELVVPVGYLPPRAEPDAFEVLVTELPLTIPVAQLLANDVGWDLALVSIDSGGHFTLSGDVVTFDPGDDYELLASGEAAQATFAYTARDHVGAEAVGEVTVTVIGLDRVLAVEVTSSYPDQVPVGFTFRLGTVLTTVGHPDTSVTWSTSDASVATVDASGSVVTHEPGAVTITATSAGTTDVAGTIELEVVPALTMTIDLTRSGGSETGFQVPLHGTGEVTVFWGDGTWETYTNPRGPSHSYMQRDAYTIHVTGRLPGGRLGTGGSGIRFRNSGALIAVLAWGDLGITSLSYAFHSATRLTYVPPTLPPASRT